VVALGVVEPGGLAAPRRPTSSWTCRCRARNGGLRGERVAVQIALNITSHAGHIVDRELSGVTVTRRCEGVPDHAVAVGAAPEHELEAPVATARGAFEPAGCRRHEPGAGAGRADRRVGDAGAVGVAVTR